MIFSCQKGPNTATWTPQFSGNRHFMFFQTILDIIFGTIPHFCLKSTNHKYSKISFLLKDKSTLVVYPCILDLGLWTQDLRICCLTHILSRPQCSLRPNPFGVYAGFMVLGVFQVGTGSFNSAVLIRFVKILADVPIYYGPHCLRK